MNDYRAFNMEQVKQIRNEYVENPKITIQYLADKHRSNYLTMQRLLAGKIYPDPEYVPVKRTKGGKKREVYIPPNIKPDSSSAKMQSLKKLRGQTTWGSNKWW